MMHKKSLRILLVEDAEFEAEITKRALSSCDFENSMTRVASGEEALSYLRHEPGFEDAVMPHLVLLDLNLPRMNGREVLHEIRNDASLSHLFVIICSASDEPSEVTKAYQATANAYITKPLGLGPLREMMNKVGDFLLNVVKIP
ncbi:response regulator receiver protein [Rhodopirellula maiorica SM1]|uniref:Response regulator receiver protein n=1 Tax=Rhodopirellula maiorica SM1 TaxID=1265738 RepID=M5RMF1_9BACT|nr:response regulator [Rhodopirellula maiorica]EMI20503.1 response regulator receiver protein [Rhodopirellula maiorica SM1]